MIFGTSENSNQAPGEFWDGRLSNFLLRSLTPTRVGDSVSLLKLTPITVSVVDRTSLTTAVTGRQPAMLISNSAPTTAPVEGFVSLLLFHWIREGRQLSLLLLLFLPDGLSSSQPPSQAAQTSRTGLSSIAAATLSLLIDAFLPVLGILLSWTYTFAACLGCHFH